MARKSRRKTNTLKELRNMSVIGLGLLLAGAAIAYYAMRGKK